MAEMTGHFLWTALGDHECHSHKSVIGDALAATAVAEQAVLVGEAQEDRCAIRLLPSTKLWFLTRK